MLTRIAQLLKLLRLHASICFLAFECDVAAIKEIRELVLQFVYNRLRNEVPGCQITLSFNRTVEPNDLILDFHQITFV